MPPISIEDWVVCMHVPDRFWDTWVNACEKVQDKYEQLSLNFDSNEELEHRYDMLIEGQAKEYARVRMRKGIKKVIK